MSNILNRKYRIGAVIVLYNPPAETSENILTISDQYDKVVVFNNSCDDKLIDELSEVKNIVVMGNGENVGIARALSLGTFYLIQSGMNYITTFDQDTRIPRDFRDCLERSIDVLAKIDPKSMIIGSNYIDPKLKTVSKQMDVTRLLFRRFTPNGYERVSSVISSGSTFSTELHRRIGLYVDEMFIDYVDNEICYRAISNGYRIFISPLLNISHSLGDREEYSIGKIKFRPTNHSTTRKYYISRNRVYCLRKYYRVLPGMIPFEFIAVMNDILRVVLYEKEKMNKLYNIIIGFRDGVVFNPRPALSVRE